MLWTYHAATLYGEHAATYEIGCKQFLQQSMTVFLYTNDAAQTGIFEENRKYSFFVGICGWIRSQNTGLVYLVLLVGRVVAVVSVLWKPLIRIWKYDVRVINKVFTVLFLYHLSFLNNYHFITFIQASSFSVHCHFAASLSVDLYLSRILFLGGGCRKMS
jgi:hypothetical protein